MFKGSVFTIGVLVSIGSVAWGVIGTMAASMSDAPSSANEAASSALWTGGVGLAVGVGLCCVAGMLL